MREAVTTGATRSRMTMWAGLALGLVVLASSIVWWFARRPTTEGPVPLRPLSVEELAHVLKRERVTAGGLESVLAPTPAVKAFAERAAAGVIDPFARAEALTKALRARAAVQAFVPWSMSELRPTAIMSADDVLKALEKDGARRELYPLEVAALEVAALRSLDVHAMVAELSDLSDERAPLDGSGYLGYFVVAVAKDEGSAVNSKMYDPYGGRALSKDAKVNILDDAAVVGAVLATRGVHESAYRADPKLALESSENALRLASRLPSVRTARGIIVLTGKMFDQGLQELSAAAQLRSDPARLHNLASARMLTGDIDAATKDLHAALEKTPDFAGARATLGAMQMIQGELDAGFAELLKAESLAPDLSLTQWLLTEHEMRNGDREAAISRGKTALSSHPSFDGRLRFALLLRKAAKYEQMRAQARAILDGAPAYRRQELRTLVETVLGPTAFDAAEPDPAADDPADAGAADLGLRLDAGSPLLKGSDAKYRLKLGLGADAAPQSPPAKLPAP